MIGSRNSESGGNSVAPATMIDVEARPTKVDRPSDVTGMVDTGNLVGQMNNTDAVRVMESVTRLSRKKLDKVSTGLATDTNIKDKIECAYVKSAGLVDRYGDPSTLDPTPAGDADIAVIFPDFDSATGRDRGEFQETASVIKKGDGGIKGRERINFDQYSPHSLQHRSVKDCWSKFIPSVPFTLYWQGFQFAPLRSPHFQSKLSLWRFLPNSSC